MGPQNAIVGDSYGTELPETQIPQEDLAEEKKMAKFSKSAEFDRIRKHVQERKDFYQKYLPGGQPVGGEVPSPEQWMAANLIINEFDLLLDSYDNAAKIVDEDNRRKGNV